MQYENLPDVIISTTLYGNEAPLLYAHTQATHPRDDGSINGLVTLSGVSVSGLPDELRKLAALLNDAADKAARLEQTSVKGDDDE